MVSCALMAKVNICDVEVLDNPATFFDKFKFKITFECHEPLEEDLEWKVVYVGSAYNSALDQTLDLILVGPVPVGRHQFVFEVDPPDPKKIPAEDLVGVTVVLIQALYRDQEFIRVGYYVNNEYKKEELRNEPPPEPLLNELERNIIATDPRVTRFPIDWGDGLLDGCPEPEQKEEEDVDTNNLVPTGSTHSDQEEEEPADEEEDDDEDVDEEETEEQLPANVSLGQDENRDTHANVVEKLLSEGNNPRPISPLHQLQNSTGENETS
ncbi:unnamed protein product [Schistocephalus solidus]|uniref:Uncharacterized protein n=2 Tax=Schistocephalus solidus TaxID=70667 RepID=A0A3P7BZ32_SCHSO|nr:unnamed protein product [Schistocephalus solidus]